MSKLKFRIHGTLPDGNDDTWLIEADTIEEVRADAKRIVELRGITNAWSEEL